MKYIDENNSGEEKSSTVMNRTNLRVDCENCFGLCCVALYFSASEGFPVDKEAGKPCINLQSDFRCKVHDSLNKRGLKGCIAYDCFGAGQKVAQVTYGGRDWTKTPEYSKQMFDVFLVVRQIHEMLWYLIEAFTLQTDLRVKEEIKSIISETEGLTFLSSESLLKLDLVVHRYKVNHFLQKTSEFVRAKTSGIHKNTSSRKKSNGRGLDLIGKDLRKRDMRGEDLRGAYLIATNLSGVDLTGADFIGADMRDTDLRGANLSNSIFLTQAQINTAKGDSKTRLPKSISRPSHWNK